ncbi:PREDICTED: uncharacterized protein LOC102018647 [Chinchilla lanigera]|uniref:uncharacterized protein LOC102018647 n=1 Tax=Chinchilla lanigera TaxID=34839 RepID=UPI0006985605|nr:PREDICTED: uncharacterized protein LOC102018647 [Chinchilla lanigera]
MLESGESLLTHSPGAKGPGQPHWPQEVGRGDKGQEWDATKPPTSYSLGGEAWCQWVSTHTGPGVYAAHRLTVQGVQPPGSCPGSGGVTPRQGQPPPGCLLSSLSLWWLDASSRTDRTAQAGARNKPSSASCLSLSKPPQGSSLPPGSPPRRLQLRGPARISRACGARARLLGPARATPAAASAQGASLTPRWAGQRPLHAGTKRAVSPAGWRSSPDPLAAGRTARRGGAGPCRATLIGRRAASGLHRLLIGRQPPGHRRVRLGAAVRARVRAAAGLGRAGRAYQRGQLGPYPCGRAGQFNDHCPPAPLFEGSRFLQAARGSGTGNPGAEAAPARSRPARAAAMSPPSEAAVGLARKIGARRAGEGRGVPAGSFPPS